MPVGSIPFVNAESTLSGLPPAFVDRIEDAIDRLLVLAARTTWTDLFEDSGLHARKLDGAQLTVRGDMNLAYSMNNVFRMCVDGKFLPIINPQVEETRQLSTFSPHSFSSHIVFKPVWPTAVRDMVNLNHWRVLADGRIIIVSFNCEDYETECKVHPDHVRADLNIGGYILTPQKASTLITYIVSTDLRGYIPTSVSNFVLKSQPSLLLNLQKYLNAKEKEKLERMPKVRAPKELDTNMKSKGDISSAPSYEEIFRSARRSQSSLEVPNILSNSTSTAPSSKLTNKKKAVVPNSDSSFLHVLSLLFPLTLPFLFYYLGLEVTSAFVDINNLTNNSTVIPEGPAQTYSFFFGKQDGDVEVELEVNHLMQAIMANPLHCHYFFVFGLVLIIPFYFRLLLKCNGISSEIPEPYKDESGVTYKDDTSGRMIVRFTSGIEDFLKYIEAHKKNKSDTTNSSNITLTHVILKSIGVALYKTKLVHKSFVQAFSGKDNLSVDGALGICVLSDNSDMIPVVLRNIHEKSVSDISRDMASQVTAAKRAALTKTSIESTRSHVVTLIHEISPFVSYMIDSVWLYVEKTLITFFVTKKTSEFCKVISMPRSEDVSAPKGDQDLMFIPNHTKQDSFDHPIVISVGDVVLKIIDESDSMNELNSEADNNGHVVSRSLAGRNANANIEGANGIKVKPCINLVVSMKVDAFTYKQGKAFTNYLYSTLSENDHSRQFSYE